MGPRPQSLRQTSQTLPMDISRSCLAQNKLAPARANHSEVGVRRAILASQRFLQPRALTSARL
eukprot:13518284-Alexandrium_andersonii.AAC.2